MKEDPQGNMDKVAYRIAYLIAGYIRNTLTEKEHDELDDWVNDNDQNMILFEELTDEKNLKANLEWMDKVQSERSFQALQEAGAFKKTGRRFKLNRVWIAAASVVILIGAFTIYRLNQSNEIKQDVAKVNTDIQPGGNRATLTLSDGSVIDLTRVENGLLKNDSGTIINKSDEGQLLYSNVDNALTTTIRYNILSIPRGGQYKVILPDGSQVWLNAASSLKYPTAFTGNSRTVELRGEGYFEVAKNNQKAFIVKLLNESEVEVLGTEFNVNTYDDERDQKITLVEGSVRIKKGAGSQTLKPGDQGQISLNEIRVVSGIDTEEISGWKNGQFIFHDADIQSVMRQIKRWYDVEVVYKTNVTKHFNGTISRNESLSRLLNLLEMTDAINFKIENKTIYVLP